jgi:alpha-ketoglutarate-dependent taurine dioxygenase
VLDVKRLIGEVAAQHGIRLDADDPAFALVTLNQLVLEETAQRLRSELAATVTQLADSFSKAEQRAGKVLAQEIRAAASEIREELTRADDTPDRTDVNGGVNWLNRLLWISVGLLSGLALFVVGFVVGKVMVER